MDLLLAGAEMPHTSPKCDMGELKVGNINNSCLVGFRKPFTPDSDDHKDAIMVILEDIFISNEIARVGFTFRQWSQQPFDLHEWDKLMYLRGTVANRVTLLHAGPTYKPCSPQKVLAILTYW
ncbi:hypothetical protein VNO78_04307 [Psophocarpus tetragonolobus]|uniref:Uncharacterized protein n=1 Tax=Psophocarpus tetragonolobus TaxID=3891 RepID=A0AAN9XWK8_PSOTE